MKIKFITPGRILYSVTLFFNRELHEGMSIDIKQSIALEFSEFS